MFTGLTEDYPELPEPYNNLAVLYASQGQYEAAQKRAGDGDPHPPELRHRAREPGRHLRQDGALAYDKALALDGKNAAAQTKLALIQELSADRHANPVTKSATARANAAATAGARPVKPQPEPSRRPRRRGARRASRQG